MLYQTRKTRLAIIKLGILGGFKFQLTPEPERRTLGLAGYKHRELTNLHTNIHRSWPHPFMHTDSKHIRTRCGQGKKSWCCRN